MYNLLSNINTQSQRQLEELIAIENSKEKNKIDNQIKSLFSRMVETNPGANPQAYIRLLSKLNF